MATLLFKTPAHCLAERLRTTLAKLVSQHQANFVNLLERPTDNQTNYFIRYRYTFCEHTSIHTMLLTFQESSEK